MSQPHGNPPLSKPVTPPEEAPPLPVVTPATAHEVQAQRDLNWIVHQLLIVGLAISIALMLLGMGLALVRGEGMPDTTASLAETLRQARAGESAGFMILGLLVLIATPILRVIGSILTFLYERDWRYVLITTAVLLIVVTCLLLGEG